jgi:hypothetical protein
MDSRETVYYTAHSFFFGTLQDTFLTLDKPDDVYRMTTVCKI